MTLVVVSQAGVGPLDVMSRQRCVHVSNNCVKGSPRLVGAR